MLISVLDILALQFKGGRYQSHVRRPNLLAQCDGGGNLELLQLACKIKIFDIST